MDTARHDEAMMALTAPVAAHAPSQASAAVVTTDIPARLDRLRWGRFHTLVVVALGITWILDGLEVTLAGAISPALKESPQLHFSNADVGLASSSPIAQTLAGTPRTKPDIAHHPRLRAGAHRCAAFARAKSRRFN